MQLLECCHVVARMLFVVGITLLDGEKDTVWKKVKKLLYAVARVLLCGFC